MVAALKLEVEAEEEKNSNFADNLKLLVEIADDFLHYVDCYNCVNEMSAYSRNVDSDRSDVGDRSALF